MTYDPADTLMGGIVAGLALLLVVVFVKVLRISRKETRK